jgi:hypothetical protein
MLCVLPDVAHHALVHLIDGVALLQGVIHFLAILLGEGRIGRVDAGEHFVANRRLDRVRERILLII